MLLEGGRVGDSLCWWWLALGWLAQHLSCSSSPPFLVPACFRPARPEGGRGRGWCCLEGGRGSEVIEQALIVGTTPEVATGAEADLLFTPSRQAGRQANTKQAIRQARFTPSRPDASSGPGTTSSSLPCSKSTKYKYKNTNE